MRFEIASANALEKLQVLAADQQLDLSALRNDEDLSVPLAGTDGLVFISSDINLVPVRLWLTKNDTVASPRAVIAIGTILRNSTEAQFRQILKRCTAFLRLLSSSKRENLLLPQPWGPDLSAKSHKSVSFFAVTEMAGSPRWIVKYSFSPEIAYFFHLHRTQEGEKVSPDSVEFDKTIEDAVRRLWVEALEQTRPLFEANAEVPLSPTIQLDSQISASDRTLNFEGWMTSGLLSARQREFISNGSDSEVRFVRGPAGTGKTLTLELKMLKDLRDLLNAEWSPNDAPRALFATHNWSMAEQVSSDIEKLDPVMSQYIDVYPLLEVILNVRPPSLGVEILGQDSEEGRILQTLVLEDCLKDFLAAFPLYEARLSPSAKELFNLCLSADTGAERDRILAELLLEFSEVLGGSEIQLAPGDKVKYVKMKRHPTWLALPRDADREAVYEVYARYLRTLQKNRQMAVDQVISDSLQSFTTFAWGHERKSEGYDLIYVDELHLFTQQERLVLGFFGRDPEQSARLFMSVDAHQSPTGRHGNFVREANSPLEEDKAVVLNEVHRYTTHILDLIKFINREIPTEDLSDQWRIDIDSATARTEAGEYPTIIDCSLSASSSCDLSFQLALAEIKDHNRVAIAVVDQFQFKEYSDYAQRLSKKVSVTVIQTRDDIGQIPKSRKGLLIGSASNLAGLQFDSVIVSGLGDSSILKHKVHRIPQFLSHLYLAVSRARKRVVFVVDSDRDGMPEVLEKAIEMGQLIKSRL